MGHEKHGAWPRCPAPACLSVMICTSPGRCHVAPRAQVAASLDSDDLFSSELDCKQNASLVRPGAKAVARSPGTLRARASGIRWPRATDATDAPEGRAPQGRPACHRGTRARLVGWGPPMRTLGAPRHRSATAADGTSHGARTLRLSVLVAQAIISLLSRAGSRRRGRARSARARRPRSPAFTGNASLAGLATRWPRVWGAQPMGTTQRLLTGERRASAAPPLGASLLPGSAGGPAAAACGGRARHPARSWDGLRHVPRSVTQHAGRQRRQR